ncbi:hypothetical protein [Amycolatopsis sp. cmx-11-12]
MTTGPADADRIDRWASSIRRCRVVAASRKAVVTPSTSARTATTSLGYR